MKRRAIAIKNIPIDAQYVDLHCKFQRRSLNLNASRTRSEIHFVREKG
jgi:hypothetical protein